MFKPKQEKQDVDNDLDVTHVRHFPDRVQGSGDSSNLKDCTIDFANQIVLKQEFNIENDD